MMKSAFGGLLIAVLLFAAGAVCWVWNLWQTFNAAEARQRAKSPPDRPQLPTLEQ